MHSRVSGQCSHAIKYELSYYVRHMVNYIVPFTILYMYTHVFNIVRFCFADMN